MGIVEKTLEELGVCIYDLKTNLKSIIDIRNKLIHGRGFYEMNLDVCLQASCDLLAMLDRMILAKLNYNGFFNDFHDKDNPQQRLMSDVRKSKATDESA